MTTVSSVVFSGSWDCCIQLKENLRKQDTHLLKMYEEMKLLNTNSCAETDRQTDGQTDRQADRQTDRERESIDRQTGRHV